MPKYATDEILDKLEKEYKAGLTTGELAVKFEISKQTVIAWLRKKKVYIDNGRFDFSLYPIDKIKEEYLLGKRQSDIVRDYNLPFWVVRKTLNSLKKRERYKPTYEVNHNAFDLATDECAYWVGWLMTDGCITKGKTHKYYKVCLCLQKNDIEILENFNSFLSSNYPILQYSQKNRRFKNGKYEYFFSESARLAIPSELLVEKLAVYGVVPRKTFTAEVPSIFKLNSHFWRGAIEGDGSISITKNKAVISLIGTESICKDLVRFYEIKTGYSLKKNPTKHKTSNVFSVYFQGKQAKLLGDLLYQNSENSRLSRKYQSYLEVCKLVEDQGILLRHEYLALDASDPRKHNKLTKKEYTPVCTNDTIAAEGL